MSEAKRGSSGGNSRKEKLTPEQRSAIAKLAAQKRWGKPKEEIPLIDPEVEKSIDRISEGIEKSINDVLRENGLHKDYPSLISGPTMTAPFIYKEEPKPQTIPVSQPKKTRPKQMPKAFKGASSYAEKRLAEAIKERAEYMGRVAALNAEIPSLVQVIRALGTSVIPPEAMQTYPTMQVPNYAMPSQQPYPQPYPPNQPMQQDPNVVDPALFSTNSNPLPGLVPAAAALPVTPNKSAGGAIDLDFVPVEEEGPALPKMGNGWV